MIIIGGKYYNSEELRNLGIKSCGSNVQIHETCQIIGAENISIGNNVRIDPWCIISSVNNTISIGSYIHIAAYCFLGGGAGIEMMDFSGISQGVRIYSITDDYSGGGLTNPTVPSKFLNLSCGKVTLDRHVLVGSGTTILPGVHIREGSAVGAMSLVRRSLDPWGLYFGIPVKRLSERTSEIINRYEKELLESLEN